YSIFLHNYETLFYFLIKNSDFCVDTRINMIYEISYVQGQRYTTLIFVDKNINGELDRKLVHRCTNQKYFIVPVRTTHVEYHRKHPNDEPSIQGHVTFLF